MSDDIVELMAKANYIEQSKAEHGFWFSGLAWEDLPDLHPVFLAGARATLAALEKSGHVIVPGTPTEDQR